MCPSKVLHRTSLEQSQLAGPWARGVLPATTVPGYAPTALNSILTCPTALPRPMIRCLDNTWNFSRMLNRPMPICIRQ